jgi:trimeric autotransporter adhesin
MLSDDAGGRFAIDSATGVVTVADMSLIDFTQKQTYSIEVTASSSDGSESLVQFSVDQNSRPVFGTSSGSYDVSYSGSLVSTVITVPVPTDVDESLDTFSVTVKELPLYGTVKAAGTAVSVNDQIPVSQLGSLTHDLDLMTKGPIGSLVLEVTDSAGLAATWTADFSVNGTSAGSLLGSYLENINESLYGSIDGDRIYGFGGDDYLSGGPGDDILSGGVGIDQLFGGLGADQLDGGVGDDYLDGGEGDDVLTGGQGNDVYVVDGLDLVVESQGGPAGGIDRIETSVDWVAPTNVEQLVATGTGDVSLLGNELNNLILGNVGANILSGGEGIDILEGRDGNDDLDGGSGRDRMIGGLGDDRYWVDGSRDIVTEDTGSGYDHVYSSVDHVLAANVEDLTLLESAVAGSGNNLDNVITGNDGNNVLTGGSGGADTLIGGGGDDIYKIDSLDDTVIDSSGIDLVMSSVSFTLTDGIENGTLTGFISRDITGNSLDNELIGTSASNRIDGKGGADTLTGGSRGDTFVFSVSDGTYDTITDFTSGSDEVEIHASVFGLENLAVLDGVSESVLGISNFATIDGDGVSSNVNAQVIYDTRDQILRVDADGAGAGVAEAIFALAGSGTTISFDDIVLFKDI